MAKQARELETPTFKRDLVGKLPANPYFFHTGTVSEREKRESVSEICVVLLVLVVVMME